MQNKAPVLSTLLPEINPKLSSQTQIQKMATYTVPLVARHHLSFQLKRWGVVAAKTISAATTSSKLLSISVSPSGWHPVALHSKTTQKDTQTASFGLALFPFLELTQLQPQWSHKLTHIMTCCFSNSIYSPFFSFSGIEYRNRQ